MNPHSPIVSVVMPVYNGRDHIAESVQSILSQSVRNLELIIIDDGSTDDTVSIINSFTDSRIRLFHNETNLKIAKSLNRGLSLSDGAFIARMDSDDLCHPERLQRQLDFLDANPEIGICGTFQQFFGGRSNRLNPTAVTHEDIMAGLLFGPTMLHPTVVFRGDVVRSHRLYYDEGFHYCEDYELWVRAARFTRLANIPEYLCRYRWTGQKNWEVDSPAVMNGLHTIWRGQLEDLGIVPSEPDLFIHAVLAGRGSPDSYTLLRQARLYLQRLSAANQVAGIYDPEAFLKLIRRVWTYLCKRLGQKTPLAWPSLVAATMMPSAGWPA